MKLVKSLFVVCLIGLLITGGLYFLKANNMLFWARPTPAQLGTIGAKIKLHPDRAGQILTENGLTRKEFESYVWEISQNPDQASQYAESYRRSMNKLASR